MPFIEAFLRNGDEVLVVGPPSLDADGYPFRSGAAPPEEALGPLWGRMPTLPPAQGEVVVVGVIFARLNVRAMLPALHEAIEEWRPDLVVRETSEYASAIATESHSVAHARVAIGLALVDEAAMTLAAAALEDVSPGIVERIARSAYATAFPASLDPAPFDVLRFREPAAATPPRPLPDWWAGDERPLVYVSFGSVAASFPPAAIAYTSALEAVAALPVRVLFTRGRELDLGPVPANVHVERWVPQADVLATAAAVVCHGGSGTTLGALASGTPLVVVPLFADQPSNAVRVAGAGAGVVVTVDGIRAGLERVLERPSYRAAAERIAGELRALPPVGDFVRRYTAT